MLVGSGVNLVELSIFTGVVNALLLPAVLGLLYWLARTQLSGTFRLQGWYARGVGLVFGFASLTGLFCGVGGLLN